MDGQNYSQELQDMVNLKTLHKGKGVAATILGIISLIGCLGPISFICGIIAIFVGANARKKSRKQVGTTGMVMGIIGVALSVIVTIGVLATVAGTAGILAPQVVEYAEQSTASSDMQLCDTVRTAATVCLLDPNVENDQNSRDFLSIYGDGTYFDVSVLMNGDTEFSETFMECMGIYSYSELVDRLGSEGAETIEISIEADSCTVSARIPGTDIQVD